MSLTLNKIKQLLAFLLIFLIMLPLNTVSANDLPSPNMSSEAYILMDSNTGAVLYEKNSQDLMYPASITKILTAIITIETQDLSEIVTVSNNAVRADGTRVYLLENEQVTLQQLLHGLMVSSGNDAAIAIAEHIDGSVEAFAERMNEFSHERIGVTQSNFTNPHGLFEEDHITTALDMAKISAYAMKNDIFRELVSTEYVDWVGEGWETRLYNHHPLLRSYEHVIGIKNGFVQKSGYTLSTAAVIGETELISITLKSPSKYYAQLDTLELLSHGFDNFETVWLDFSNEPLLPHYHYPKALPITVQKNHDIHYRISDDGYVTIKNGQNETLQVVPLEKREVIQLPKFVVAERREEEIKFNNSDKIPWLDWLIITGFLFLHW